MRNISFVLTISMVVLAAGCMGEVVGLPGGLSHAPVCPDPAPGEARCHAHVVVDSTGQPDKTSAPVGYGPSDLWSAYKLPGVSGTGGAGQTVAIVDAYDDPTAAIDLAAYRSHYNLPPVPSFTKVNQNGIAGSYPKANSSWSQEISIDLEMVSAVCPNCNILLVEADSASSSDLAAAVDTAASMGANAISNSYGSNEASGDSTYAAAYAHAGVAITASSGDSGYGAQTPAAYATVTAVGGTSLKKASNARGWSETAWSGSGSGCSSYVAKPAWQGTTGCANRALADVSAVADPNTGVAVYMTLHGRGSWLQFGGNSAWPRPSSRRCTGSPATRRRTWWMARRCPTRARLPSTTSPAARTEAAVSPISAPQASAGTVRPGLEHRLALPPSDTIQTRTEQPAVEGTTKRRDGASPRHDGAPPTRPTVTRSRMTLPSASMRSPEHARRGCNAERARCKRATSRVLPQFTRFRTAAIHRNRRHECLLDEHHGRDRHETRPEVASTMNGATSDLSPRFASFSCCHPEAEGRRTPPALAQRVGSFAALRMTVIWKRFSDSGH